MSVRTLKNISWYTDPRAKEYIYKYGKISWELDSIEPEVLMDLTENAILKYLDVEKYNAWISKEKKDSKTLTDFGKSLKKKKED